MAADIKIAYLQAPISEKHFIICCEEFGIENVGKRVLVGRNVWHHLQSCMKHMDFESLLADPDVQIQKAKQKNGEEYYEYILLYVDDCLVISERAESTLHDKIGRYFELKEESITKPSQYLGVKLCEVKFENRTT